MVAIYVRVSGVDQNTAGQKREIQRWLDGNGIVDARWYIDKSAANTADSTIRIKIGSGGFGVASTSLTT